MNLPYLLIFDLFICKCLEEGEMLPFNRKYFLFSCRSTACQEPCAAMRRCIHDRVSRNGVHAAPRLAKNLVPLCGKAYLLDPIEFSLQHSGIRNPRSPSPHSGKRFLTKEACDIL